MGRQRQHNRTLLFILAQATYNRRTYTHGQSEERVLPAASLYHITSDPRKMGGEEIEEDSRKSSFSRMRGWDLEPVYTLPVQLWIRNISITKIFIGLCFFSLTPQAHRLLLIELNWYCCFRFSEVVDLLQDNVYTVPWLYRCSLYPLQSCYGARALALLENKIFLQTEGTKVLRFTN